MKRKQFLASLAAIAAAPFLKVKKFTATDIAKAHKMPVKPLEKGKSVVIYVNGEPIGCTPESTLGSDKEDYSFEV
jgi:hypothetical protein